MGPELGVRQFIVEIKVAYLLKIEGDELWVFTFILVDGHLFAVFGVGAPRKQTFPPDTKSINLRLLGHHASCLKHFTMPYQIHPGS